MNIIFDFDGVIINSHKIKSLAFYEVFKKFGKTYAKKALNYHLLNIGKSRYYKFKFILKNIIRLQANSELIKNLDKEFDNFIYRKIKKLKPSIYLIKLLKNKTKSQKFFISTGTPQKKIVKILKEKNLFQYFEKIYGSPKTKVNHIKEIKKKYTKLIFVGDSYEDYNAAKKTKIAFLLKLNSENLILRNKIECQKFNSFKFLQQKIRFTDKHFKSSNGVLIDKK